MKLIKYSKKELWDIATGLQSVDSLSNSNFMLMLIDDNINGLITLKQLKHKLYVYYNSCDANIKKLYEESDKASVGIVECILNNNKFELTLEQIIKIHRIIFYGFDFAGKIRGYNIIKEEEILNGDTVLYSSHDIIVSTVNYDLSMLNIYYINNITKENLKEFATCISNLWQVHPFGEGNTRTIVVFIIMMLKNNGIKVKSNVFKESSLYFRNALVRANYDNFPNGIVETKQYMCEFLDNAIFHGDNKLINSDLQLNI